MKYQKILIIGISCTGKTTLAKELSQQFNLPVYHYDQFGWKNNWQEVDKKTVNQEFTQIAKRKQWVVEGWLEPAASLLLKNADLVLYLDYSGFLAFIGGLKRWWQYRGRTRPELAPGCIETFNWEYLKVMWHQSERPYIEKAINGFEEKVIRIQNTAELKQFIHDKFV
ncbi:MAG: AAA family ATPase [Patescibacteria group bacterium]